MTKRRETWVPGQSGDAPDPAPSSPPPSRPDAVPGGPVRRATRPAWSEDEPEPEAPSTSESATNRAMPVRVGPSVETTGGDRDPSGPGASPFAGFAPSSAELTLSAEVAKESSNQVIALVLATLFAGAAVAGVALLLLIAFLTWNHLEGQGSADDADKKAHVRDTGVAPVIDIDKPVRRGGGGNADADGDADGGVAVPVTTGPITIQIPKDRFFHSLEINCPDAGIRRRATFRRHRASTSGVPIAEECMVTFQGSEPAKTTIRGGQRKRCESFNPTRCVLY